MGVAEARSANEWYKPATPNWPLRHYVETSADEELGPAAAGALQRAASCDAPLFADALRMAGLLAGVVLSLPEVTVGAADGRSGAQRMADEGRWIDLAVSGAPVQCTNEAMVPGSTGLRDHI